MFYSTSFIATEQKQIKANKNRKQKQKQKENKYESRKDIEQKETKTETEKQYENQNLCQIVVRKTLTHLNYRSNQHLVFQSVAFSGKFLLCATPALLPFSPNLSLSLLSSFKLVSTSLSLPLSNSLPCLRGLFCLLSFSFCFAFI